MMATASEPKRSRRPAASAPESDASGEEAPVSPSRVAGMFEVFQTPCGFQSAALAEEVLFDEGAASSSVAELREKTLRPPTATASSELTDGSRSDSSSVREEVPPPVAPQKPVGLSDEAWRQMLTLREQLGQEKKRLRDYMIQMREKREREAEDGGGVESSAASEAVIPRQSGTEPVTTAGPQPVPVEEEEEEEFDMFAAASSPVESVTKKRKARGEGVAKKRLALAPELQAVDMVDDPEGYYRPIVGELLDSRYKVLSGICGKGMFSSVIRCVDESQPHRPQVAVKIIRRNDLMKKAGEREIENLRRLNDRDPEDRRHIVRLLYVFEHKHHLCLVFENLSLNLRALQSRYGHGRGLNLQAVIIYARQVMVALRHMKRTGLMHADIKPDNILVNAKLNSLKICDLGSAADVSENEITAYLVSRYYRAPEIILGCKFGPPIDMWSVACTLYELATGKFLFSGRDNNNMLYQMMRLKGRFPKSMLRNAEFASKHFTEDLTDFKLHEFDPKFKKVSIKTVSIPQQPVRSISDRLLQELPIYQSGSAGDSRTAASREDAAQFAKFLDACLALDPAKRLTSEQALEHPFLAKSWSSNIHGPPQR